MHRIFHTTLNSRVHNNFSECLVPLIISTKSNCRHVNMRVSTNILVRMVRKQRIRHVRALCQKHLYVDVQRSSSKDISNMVTICAELLCTRRQLFYDNTTIKLCKVRSTDASFGASGRRVLTRFEICIVCWVCKRHISSNNQLVCSSVGLYPNPSHTLSNVARTV